MASFSFFLPEKFSLENREHIYLLQQALTALKYEIVQQEITDREYGESTKVAVASFQQAHALGITVAPSSDTISAINKELQQLYRIFGIFTNKSSMPVFAATAVLLIDGKETTSELTLQDGSFRFYPTFGSYYLDARGQLRYYPKVDIKIYQNGNSEPVFTSSSYISEIETVFNFTSDQVILTDSFYDICYEKLDNYYKRTPNAVGKSGDVNFTIENLWECSSKDLKQISLATGINMETLMQLIIGQKLSTWQKEESNKRDSTINEAITPAVCFALLSQNSITAMPQQLYQDIDEKQEWTDYKNKLVNIAEIGLTQLSPTNIADTLTTASQLNRIPFLMIDDIENISDNIIENNENVRGVEPLLAGGQNITKLIEIAEAAYGFSLSSNPKKDVVTKFIDNSTNFNAFIADLESNKTQDDGTDELVAVFNLSRVTRNFTPLIEKILDSYKDDIKNDIRYVATFSKVNWEGIIIGNNTNGSGYPEDFTSVDEYAQFLVNVCQELYTDIATISLLIEDSEELGLNKLSEIRNALLANTNFNLLTSNYDALDLADDMDAISELRQIQEIYRITPTPEAVRVMFKNKITSASQVYFMGKRELEHRLKDSSLSQANIDSIFDAASGRFANNLNAFFHIQSLLSHASLMAIGGANKENLKDKFPNLKDLFNELDYCECEHDSSVYSAAAYLADLLNFLENRTVQSGKTVKDFLYYDQGNPDNLLRRKDIGKIWLNTQNTNTVLPYIDLVCEVLEEAVLRISYADYEREEEEDYQTTLTAKELLAAPEHILRNKYQNDITAYDILKEKSYPMFAPLNLWQTEIRAYLKFMGIERYQLMEAFQGHDNASGTYTPTHANIAAEYFGLTSLEENLIITSTQPAESEDLRETEEPESANDSNNPWHTELKEDKGLYKMPIADFLQDSGLSVPELIDICNYYYGDTSNIIRWVQLTLESFEDCSYTNKDISGNNASSFDRAHRFIRLYRKSGWKIWELDLLLRSSVAHFNTQNLEGLDNLDAETLSNLMLFKKQQETLKLSVEELLACYAKINTETIIEKGKKKPCLYDRLFLQKSLSDPINQNLSNIKQGKEGASLNDNDQPLITACLSLKESDFQFLQSKWDKSNPYDLSYLTFLYRHGILAKKLKISAEDLFTVFTLLNENIVYDDYYTLSVIDTVIATVAKIKASKLTIAEYEYLALYTCPESTSTRDVTISYKAQELALSKEILDQYTTLLQSALSKAIRPPAENDFFKDEEASTEHWEASIPYKEYFTDYLLATEQYSLEDIEELIRIIECVSDKTDNEIDVFTKQMFISTDYFPVQINLHKEYPLEKEALIVRYKNVGFFVDAGLLSATVINYFSEWFELSAVTVQFYLGYYLGPKYLQGTSFSDMLLNAFEGTNGSLLLLSLHKVSLLINKKQISEADLALLLDMPMPTTQQPFIWYNFTLSVPDGNTLTDFLKLDALLALQKRYGTMGETDTLFSLLSKFAHGTLENNLFFALLCQLTSWDPVQFKQLQQDDALHYKLNDFYDPETYQKMGQCLDIIDKTGVTVSFIETWKLRDNDESLIAQQVKGAAKAHYDLDTWLDKLPAIQNPIREAKSHALSSFLIACSMRGEIDSLRWNDQTELYNYFLLDTEMKPIMKTSRLVQATLSVQLFVQRCLLGLENSAIKTNEDTWQQWEWMKKYRVWEANRKVFLYPENWIEPELRDDKTPFFKDMEDELNQGDITNELAETAFENYLQKLKDVSNLFVCGIYREFVNGNDGQYNGGLILKASKVDTTHVIARSRSTPYQYYYRAYDAIGKKWSYWESVELDIKGDVVIPMIYNRKLHLFWLSPVQKSKNRNTGGEVGDKRAPVNYTEIQLGWSILKNRKFTAVNYSSKKMLIKGQTVTDTFSLIAQYIEARNEIEFSVLQHMEDGDMTVEERTSTASLLTGKFFFNENVYRVNSIIHNAKDIPDGGSQDDDLNTEQKTFKVIAKEMSVEERTELKFVEGNYDRWDEITRNDPDDSTITYYYYDYVIRYPNAALLASRLYSRTGNFYFDLNNESWFPIYSILETQNRPISIKMLHHPDGEWQ
ncbi:MAG: hypothetical protein LBL79_09240, partial [Prevotella sp.]|nr:hypothetical protein [Prevotella sp.]